MSGDPRPRVWWAVGRENLAPGGFLVEAPSRVAAKAILRAKMIKADMLAGHSRRAALRFSRMQYGPPWIEAGPFNDQEACAYDIGWTLAEAVTRKQSTTALLEPAGPITPRERELAVFWLGEEITALIETKIAARYGITTL